MSQQFLNGKQKMNVAAISARDVEEAQTKAKALCEREWRFHGDYEAAMHRVSAKYGIPFGTLWGLHYKKPKTVISGVLGMLRQAYEAECARQLSKLRHELSITKETGNATDLDLVREIEALLEKVRGRETSG